MKKKEKDKKITEGERERGKERKKKIDSRKRHQKHLLSTSALNIKKKKQIEDTITAGGEAEGNLLESWGQNKRQKTPTTKRAKTSHTRFCHSRCRL